MKEGRGSIPGGQALRRLRERMDWSQLDLAINTEVVTQPNYSKIESGQTQPSQEKLCAILEVLEPSQEEYAEVLKFFGYLPPTPLPDDDDVDKVIAHCDPMLIKATTPIFIVDLVTRLFHWNALYARLLGDEGEEILGTMRGRPVMQIAFERKQEIGARFGDLDTILLDEAATIQRRLKPFQQERWSKDFLTDIAYDTPSFAAYWERVQNAVAQQAPTDAFPAKPPAPVKFNVPGIIEPLSFFGHAQTIPADTRFQAIALLAADGFTWETIGSWCTSGNVE